MDFKARMDGFFGDVMPMFKLSPAKKISKKEGNELKKDDKMRTRFLEAWNNFRYEFGSDATLKKDIPIWILGVRHHTANYDHKLLDENEQDDQLPVFNSTLAKQVFTDFGSRPWFTYRKQFPPIEGTNITSDTGWGCMLRTAQMMIAQGLMNHHLGRDWRWYQKNCNKHLKHLHKNIIRLFIDHPDCPLSLQCLSQTGRKYGNIPGNWYGPNTVAYIMQQAVNTEEHNFDEFSGIAVYVAQDCTVYSDDVYDLCGWSRDSDEDISRTTQDFQSRESDSDSETTSSASSFCVDEIGSEAHEILEFSPSEIPAENLFPARKLRDGMIPMREIVRSSDINPEVVIEEPWTDESQKFKHNNRIKPNTEKISEDSEPIPVVQTKYDLSQNTKDTYDQKKLKHTTEEKSLPRHFNIENNSVVLNESRPESELFSADSNTKQSSLAGSESINNVLVCENKSEKHLSLFSPKYKSNFKIRDIFKDLPQRAAKDPESSLQMKQGSSLPTKNMAHMKPQTDISLIFSSNLKDSPENICDVNNEKDQETVSPTKRYENAILSSSLQDSTLSNAHLVPNLSNANQSQQTDVPANKCQTPDRIPLNRTDSSSSEQNNSISSPGVYSEFLFKESVSCDPSPTKIQPLLTDKPEQIGEKFSTFDSAGKPRRINPFSPNYEFESSSSDTHNSKSTVGGAYSAEQHVAKNSFSSNDIKYTGQFSATTNETSSIQTERPKSVIILIPVRLGESSLNPIYIPCIQAMLSLKSSIGIIGGKPKHSLYFVGYQDENLLHLDPHYCQVADSPDGFKKNIHDYHTMNIRKTNAKKIDPSCCFGFYCKNSREFEQFKEEGKGNPSKDTVNYPMFLIMDGHSGDHQFSPSKTEKKTLSHEAQNDLTVASKMLSGETHDLALNDPTEQLENDIGASATNDIPQKISNTSSTKSAVKSSKKVSKVEGFSEEMSAKLNKLIPDPSKFYPKFMRQKSSSPTARRKNKNKEEESLESQFELL